MTGTTPENGASASGGGLVAAIDVGGTVIKAGLVDRAGTAVHEERHPTSVERGQVALVDAVIDIAAGPALPNPVPLGQIKDDPRLAAWPLVKIGRLSVVPTSPAEFAAVIELAGRGGR